MVGEKRRRKKERRVEQEAWKLEAGASEALKESTYTYFSVNYGKHAPTYDGELEKLDTIHA